VKAHVGAVFEKLQVRDRLQLSIRVNSRSLKE
jgi:DNA-binding NarL/FixJ family response regulator